MCLITLAYKSHPKFDLIFAANRDEEYKRPTRAAQFWHEQPNILAGKDLKAGGTWMGVNKNGQFSAITNYRDPSIQKRNPPSRGHLVLEFLKKSETAKAYLDTINDKADQYMGFNLLTGSVKQLGYYSNQQKEIKMLEPGIYGLSNHLLDTSWPKVELAKKQLSTIIYNDNVTENALFSLLADDRQAPDEKLPDTGLPKEIEKKVSPIFIKGAEYGTRCSTIFLITKNGEVTFVEKRFKAGTQEVEETNRYEFKIA